MKNLIKNKILASLIILITIAPAYSAQRIKNMSMTVEDTNEMIKNAPAKQATTINNYVAPTNNNNDGTGFDDSLDLDPNMARQLREINSRDTTVSGLLGSNPLTAGKNGIIPPPPTRGVSQQSYINQFCSSNYAAKNTGSQAMQTCQENQRLQSCERFARATVNVQKILSQAIDCEHNTSGLIASGCDGLDASRLDLLKQSWQDEDLSYTILFLPDLVLNSASNCANKR